MVEVHVINPSIEYSRFPSSVVATALFSSKTLTLLTMVVDAKVMGVHVFKLCV